MRILINDKPVEIDAESTVLAAIKHFGCRTDSVAIALDGKFLPRHQWSEHALKEGQELEVVSPMQGG